MWRGGPHSQKREKRTDKESSRSKRVPSIGWNSECGAREKRGEGERGKKKGERGRW